MPTDSEIVDEYKRSGCVIATAARLGVTASAALKAIEAARPPKAAKAPLVAKRGLPGRNSQGWREIAGRRVYMRSKWEANYGRYLAFLEAQGAIKGWEHEPHTFWFDGIKRGVCSYLPDYRITRPDGSTYWVEVKGHMDAKSLTKLKRMRKYFLDEDIMVIDGAWFAKNGKKLSSIVPNWE